MAFLTSDNAVITQIPSASVLNSFYVTFIGGTQVYLVSCIAWLEVSGRAMLANAHNAERFFRESQP